MERELAISSQRSACGSEKCIATNKLLMAESGAQRNALMADSQ